MARIIFNGPEAVLRLPSLGVEVPRGCEWDVPAEIAAQLLAWPAVDVDVYPDEPVPRPDATPPPKVGIGSGRAAWAEYAVALGVPILCDWSRDRIIAACEQALATAEDETPEPEPGPDGEQEEQLEPDDDQPLNEKED